jgi:hypothetical protein
VPQTSPVFQLELSANSAGKLGVESEGQNAEITEQTAGTAVDAKSALNANHTASRTKLASHA